jgi:hypothetical protein
VRHAHIRHVRQEVEQNRMAERAFERAGLQRKHNRLVHIDVQTTAAVLNKRIIEDDRRILLRVNRVERNVGVVGDRLKPRNDMLKYAVASRSTSNEPAVVERRQAYLAPCSPIRCS